MWLSRRRRLADSARRRRIHSLTQEVEFIINQFHQIEQPFIFFFLRDRHRNPLATGASPQSHLVSRLSAHRIRHIPSSISTTIARRIGIAHLLRSNPLFEIIQNNIQINLATVIQPLDPIIALPSQRFLVPPLNRRRIYMRIRQIERELLVE